MQWGLHNPTRFTRDLFKRGSLRTVFKVNLVGLCSPHCMLGTCIGLHCIFIQDLYPLADNCEYGTLKDQLIRDRIVVGDLDDTLSDRLRAKSDLTLADTAPRMSRQGEARKQNRTFVRKEETQTTVEYVSRSRSSNKQPMTNNKPARSRYERSTKEPPRNDNPSKTNRPCFWCGRQNHNKALERSKPTPTACYLRSRT